MSISKTKQFLAGVINQASNIIVPFIITFIALNQLPKELGSVWLIFLSMVVLVILFDFGLSPTIIRNVSYVIAGARKLAKNNIDEIDFGDSISYGLLKRLVNDTRGLYKKLSLIASVIILVFGSGYFYYISPANIVVESVISWILFGLGLLLSFYYLYYTPMLSGLGEIHLANIANTIGRITWLLLVSISIPFKLSLLSISGSFLLSVIVIRVFSSYFFNRNYHIRAMADVPEDTVSTIPYISGSAIKLGIATLGGFLINRSTVIIAGMVLSLTLAGQFTFTMQIFLAIMSVSNVYLAMQIPNLSQLVIKKNAELLKKEISKVILFSIALYISGVIVFLISADFIVSLTRVKVGFLEHKYIIIMSLMFLLDLNHNVCASILTVNNKIPFVIPVLISGFLIVITALVLVGPLHLGVAGLIMAQGIIQICYNNWRWPLMIYKDFYAKS